MAVREWWGDWCVGGGCGGWRVATARRCISLKIDAQRPAASSARSDATAKEKHVNYDVSNVLVEACGAPTTGSGWYGLVLVARRRVVESSIFPVGPCRCDHRCRACREGSWGGGRSLVGADNSVVPCGGHGVSDDGKLHHCECNLPYFTLFGVIFTAGTPRLRIPASQWHGEVLPPCHCGARITSMQYKCNAFSAKGVDFG